MSTTTETPAITPATVAEGSPFKTNADGWKKVKTILEGIIAAPVAEAARQTVLAGVGLVNARAWFIVNGKEKDFLPWAEKVTGNKRSWVYNAMKAGAVSIGLGDSFGTRLTDAHLAALDRVPEDDRVKVLAKAGARPDNDVTPDLATLRKHADAAQAEAAKKSGRKVKTPAEKRDEAVATAARQLSEPIRAILTEPDLLVSEVIARVTFEVAKMTAGEDRASVIRDGVKSLCDEYDREQNPDPDGQGN